MWEWLGLTNCHVVYFLGGAPTDSCFMNAVVYVTGLVLVVVCGGLIVLDRRGFLDKWR